MQRACGSRALAGPQSLAAAAVTVLAVVPSADAAALHLRALAHYGEDGKLALLGATCLLYGLTCCVGLAAAALLVCCIYDAAAHWCHRAHFHSCQKKVRRVHEGLLNKKGELPLCPYCIEFIPNQSSPSKVVFLCGHRFHTDCANRWFQEHPEEAGRCPICEAASPPSTEDGAAGGDRTGAEAAASNSDTCNDEAQIFILKSLHRRYPEFVPESCVQRWASCHTEIWLSELTCPRYNSILSKHSQKQVL